MADGGFFAPNYLKYHILLPTYSSTPRSTELKINLNIVRSFKYLRVIGFPWPVLLLERENAIKVAVMSRTRVNANSDTCTRLGGSNVGNPNALLRGFGTLFSV